jgi:hypothetical protein
MKNILKILLIIALLKVTLFCIESNSIKGIVKDKQTGETIPFATIIVENTKYGTYANTNGFFFIKGISDGKFKVTATAVGYNKKTIEVDIKKGETISLSFELEPIPIELQGVTKVSERMKEAYKNEISVQALSQQELKIIPSTSEKDIFKLIQILPGVSSTGDVTSQFYVRGGSGDQNMILYDNMMIYSPFHAFGMFSIFNTDVIKISEMMTGGFSPEYGGRLSSVMNIISKDGNSNKYSGKLNIGNSSAQALVEGPILGGSLISSARKSYFNNVFKKFLGKNIPLDFYDINSKLTFPIANEGKFSFSAIISRDNINQSAISSPNYLWQNAAVGTNVQVSIEDYYLDVALSFSFSKAYVDYKGFQGRQNSENRISNIFFDAKAESYLFEKDILSYGFSFILPRTEYSFQNSSGLVVKNKLDQQESGIFVKYRFGRIEGLGVDVGIRSNFEFIAENISYAFEPRIKVTYQPFHFATLKASYGKYHQTMITTSNEDDIIPLFEIWLPVEKPYYPERCDEYIGALETDLSDNLSFSFQGYFKRFTNLLGYNLKKKNSSDPDFSSGTGRSYGYEFFLKYQDESLYTWINYTLSWAKRKSDRVKYSPKYDRKHIINILSSYRLPYDIHFNLKWELASGTLFTPVLGYFDRLDLEDFSSNNYYFDTGSSYGVLGSKNASRLPWYHRLDIGLSKSLTIYNSFALNLKVDLINLYDRKNIFYINKDTGEKVYMLPFMFTFFVGLEI